MYKSNVVKLSVNAMIMAIIAMIIVVYLPNSGAQEDPYIDNVIYSRDNAESYTIVESGRDNSTFYKYLIINDYSEAPVNWSEPDFNDTSWVKEPY